MRFKETVLCLLLGLGFTSPQLLAQDLHIYYNLFNDSVVYKLDDKVLEKPKLRNGQEIHFHLTEYNNFIYDIELDIKQDDIMQTSGIMEVAQFTGLGPDMAMDIGGERTGSAGSMGLLDAPLLNINGGDVNLMSLLGARSSAAKMISMATTTMEEITSIQAEVKVLTEEIVSYEKSRDVSQMALAHVDTLKRHPNLKPSFIKKRCEEYYNAIFRTPGGGGVTLEELLAIQQVPGRYEKAVNRLRSREGDLNSKVTLLASLNEQFVNMTIDDAAFLKFVSDLQGFRKDAEAFDKQLKNALEGPASMSDYPTKAELTNLQFSLAEVISNDFTYHSRIKSYNDVLNIHIKMVKKEHPVGEEKEVVKSRHLRLEAKGGLKITASVGLNFSRFMSPGHDYSVRNNVIVEDNSGVFVPAATSFLHFYGYNGGKLSLGGSFGIGFPVMGDEDNQSLQFFIGPSLIFGTSQRMVLNFGLMGGKVTRLSRGYETGDEFDDSFGDIPTRNPYELGFFIGTSFNLGAN